MEVAAILVMRLGLFIQTVVPLNKDAPWSLSLIGLVVLEDMFKDFGL